MKQKRAVYRNIYSSHQEKSLKSMIKRELVLNFGYADKLSVADLLAEKIIDIFNEYAPDNQKVHPLQTVWVGIDENDGPARGKTIQHTKQKSCVINLWTQDEISRLADGKASLSSLLKERIVRITKEAKEQGSLFNATDLSLLFSKEVSSIRKLVQHYEQQTGKFLPLRSRVHDMGLTPSHKKHIIFLYLKGYLTSEIARLSDHDPENVDRYIKNFNRVYELFKDNLSVDKISFITGITPKVVKEYINLSIEFKSNPDQAQVIVDNNQNLVNNIS